MPTSKKRRRHKDINYAEESENDDHSAKKINVAKCEGKAKNHLILSSANAQKRDLVAAFGDEVAVAAKRLHKKLGVSTKLKNLTELRDSCHLAIDNVLRRVADDCGADFNKLPTHNKQEMPHLKNPDLILKNLVAALEKSKKNSIENKTLRATLCKSLSFPEVQKVTSCAKNTYLRAKDWYKLLMEGESLESDKVSRRCFDPAVVDDALINWILSPSSVGFLTSGSKFIKVRDPKSGEFKELQKVMIPAYTLQVEKVHLWTKYSDRKKSNNEGYVSRGSFFEIMKHLVSITIHKKPPEFCIESLVSEPIGVLMRIVNDLLKSDMIFCHKYVPRLKNVEIWMLHGYMKKICKQNELTHNSDYAMARGKYKESKWLERYGKPPCTCIYSKEPFLLLDKLRTHPFIQSNVEALEYIYDCYDKFEFYMGRVQAELSIRRKKRKSVDGAIGETNEEETGQGNATKMEASNVDINTEDKKDGINFDDFFKDDEEISLKLKSGTNTEDVGMDEIQTIFDNDTATEPKPKQDTKTTTTPDEAKNSEEDTVVKTTKLDEIEDQLAGGKDELTKDDHNKADDKEGITKKLGNDDEDKENNDEVVENENVDDKKCMSDKIESTGDEDKQMNDKEVDDDEESVVRVYGIKSADEIPLRRKKKNIEKEPPMAAMNNSSKTPRPPQRKDMLSYAIERVRDKEFLTPQLILKPNEQEELESYQLPSHLFQLGYAIRRPTGKTYGEIYVDKHKKDILSVVQEGIPNQNLFAEHILKKMHEKYPKRYRFPSQYIISKEFASSLTHRIYPKSTSNERKTPQQKTSPMRDADENISADFSDDSNTPIQTPKKNRSTRFWKLEENQDIVAFIEESIADMIRFDEKCRISDVMMRVKERFPDRALPNDNVLKNKVGSLHARVIRTPELDTDELKNHFHSSQNESQKGFDTSNSVVNMDTQNS